MTLLTALVSVFLAITLGSAGLVADDSGMVMTPQGLRKAANVHLVPEGGEVRMVADEVHLLDASGTVLHVAPQSAAARAPFPDGWTAYAQWINNATGTSPISYFNTTWTVPAAPTTNDNQIVYLFNALMPISGSQISQPVLQWGVSDAGGGALWEVASWWVLGDDAYYSSLVEVNEGDVLNGAITLTNVGETIDGVTECDYIVEFIGIEGTTLTLTTIPEVSWATVTLEAYDIDQISDYPGSTVFSGMNIEIMKGTPEVTWQTINDTADGITAAVDIDGSTNAEVTIHI